MVMPKNHGIVYLKWVNWMGRELYLSIKLLLEKHVPFRENAGLSAESVSPSASVLTARSGHRCHGFHSWKMM